jgi:3-oxoadipate enol-lactonase
VVVGLSMGGYIALAMARRYAQRITGLLLADTKAGPDSEEAKQGRAQNITRARAEGVTAVFDGMRPKVFGPSSDEKVIEELRTIASQQTPSATIAALEMMRDRPDATPLLASISVPTTIVVGTNDGATPPSEAEIMHRGIKNSRLITIEGAGHFTNVERPDEFNRALRELLERL